MKYSLVREKSMSFYADSIILYIVINILQILNIIEKQINVFGTNYFLT